MKKFLMIASILLALVIVASLVVYAGSDDKPKAKEEPAKIEKIEKSKCTNCPAECLQKDANEKSTEQAAKTCQGQCSEECKSKCAEQAAKACQEQCSEECKNNCTAQDSAKCAEKHVKAECKMNKPGEGKKKE